MLILTFTVHYIIYVAEKTGFVFKEMLQDITMRYTEFVNDKENKIAVSLHK
jgi:hypothetical protein